jgi:ABC-type multidrug transport system ATPase subunit
MQVSNRHEPYGCESTDVRSNESMAQPTSATLPTTPGARAAETPVSLTWDALRYTVKVKDDDGKMVDKELLHGVSGTARSCRTLAVMGPSGAGKSTFLNGVCGRLQIDKDHVMHGTAYLNDVVFSGRYKPLVSYVAQDDIVMGKDTPREALKFSYRLRSGATSEEADLAVTEMLAKLSLQACADTLLGVPGLLKGVSGGEKKRTNIGAELINNPLILMLDEPTTGLDSVNALRVGLLLRELAHHDRRTVICTIHSPSSELYDVFDDILLLAKGSVVYHGACKDAPAYFSSIGYSVPPRMNPSEHFMNLLQLPKGELDVLISAWKERAQTEDIPNRSIRRTPQPGDVRTSDNDFDRIRKCSKTGYCTQLMVLLQRSGRNLYRDPAGIYGRLAQVLFLAVLLALMFANLTKDDDGVQDRAGVLVLVVLNLTFMNVLNAIAIFPPERAVFLQEQASNTYNAGLYYLSKVIAETPFLVGLATVYSVIIYWSLDLATGAVPFFNFLVVAILLANLGNAFGLFVAALFPRPDIAMTVAPLMVMPQMLVAGLFVNTERLEPYWVWLNYIAFPRYAYKALFVNEFSHSGTLCSGGDDCRFRNGQDVVVFYGFDKATDAVWFNVLMMIVLMFALRSIGAIALYVQAAKKRSRMVFDHNFRHAASGHPRSSADERSIEMQ